MIADADLDRIIATWLAEGPERAPREHVYDALAEVRSTRQRPRWIPVFRDDEDRRRSQRWALVVAVVALLIAAALAVGVGSGLIRVPSPPPPPVTNRDVELRPIHIEDWSANVSIPTTWSLVGDATQLADTRRFVGAEPEGELTVSHESPYQVTICDPGCEDVALPMPIPFSATTLLDALKDDVASIAGDDAWVDLGAAVLPKLEGGARLDTTKRDPSGRAWHHVYIVGLRDRNAAAIGWRQPVDAFDASLFDAVLAALELPAAPVYSDGDLITSNATGADFTMPVPGFWATSEQPQIDGKPLDGVFRFGPDRLTVSIGSEDGTFGWCEADCQELRGMTSLDTLEAALGKIREIGPSSETTLGGEPGRTFVLARSPARRYTIAMHRGRPVAVMIDPGDWDVAEGIIDQMLMGFAFIDPPPPPPPERSFTMADGRVELGLPSGWYAIDADPGALHNPTGKERLSVEVGSEDGSIVTCDNPAAPWELCREVKVKTLDDLEAAVQPAPIADHGVGPPAGRTDTGTLDGEPSVVVRIQAYEYPARSGQEVVYIATLHHGRPYLVRIHTRANEVYDLAAVIAGFRFSD